MGILGRVMGKLLGKVTQKISAEMNNPSLQAYNQQAAQRRLYLHYKMLCENEQQLPKFQDTGFRVYSQTDEDGLLLYVFSLIGFTNKVLVDIACGTPYGANTTNLICNWGFTGLLVEGSEENVETTRRFFASHPDTYIFPPKVECSWVTAENINDILYCNGISGEIDLLSLDVDGVDYWLWKNLSIIQPRVVVIEAATFWGKQRSVTVPYEPKFNRFDTHPDYMGASISAFVKLSREKGYRLVASNRFGYNIFFVRDDIGTEMLPEISVEECFHFAPLDLEQRREARLQSVMDYNWIEV
ncbi:MAG TPA: hypothetical protein VGK02_08215 [Candidatus Aquicultor sp.]|jgi:hypothetical protein